MKRKHISYASPSTDDIVAQRALASVLEESRREAYLDGLWDGLDVAEMVLTWMTPVRRDGKPSCSPKRLAYGRKMAQKRIDAERARLGMDDGGAE